MIDILFFAIIAFVIGLKLYSALGHKNFEPGKVVTVPKVENKPDKIIEANYTVIRPEDEKELEERYGKPLAEKIREVRKYDPSFTVDAFVNGAKKAFEVIVKAFSSGDKEALKPLLSKNIYKSFSDEIDKKQAREEVEETTLVAILSSNIKDIALNKKCARIAVQIVSEQINIIRDKQGKIIAGNPSQVDKIQELWTFGRDLSSNNPNWELLETAVAV